jgi:hypothetical protein
MTQTTTPPASGLNAFNCPHCGAFAEQNWYGLAASGSHQLHGWQASRCRRCMNYGIWENGAMVFPDASVIPLPNEDMPADITQDYNEARTIAGRSARGAAALLRLCIQKLCKYLEQPGKDLNSDIAELVKQGLNPKIQRSLDVVRVIGNEAVHPGTIDLRDDPAMAGRLATLVNIIADAMITQPKLVDHLYEGLPETKKEQISRRDMSTTQTRKSSDE